MNETKTLLAHLTRTGSQSVASAARDMGDKLTWKPLDKGRTALNQVVECAGITSLTAQIFESGEMPPFDSTSMQQFFAENESPEKAFPLLEQATERLVRAIEAIPEENLNKTITLPFGPGMQKTIAEVALLNYWNFAYHEGQINYIQTLCAE